MKLNEDTFVILAIKNYDMKRAASAEEIKDDLKRFQYLKKLFKRYEERDDLKVRLILNHMIVLYNCLGPIATHMLFMRLESYHKYLKPFVVFLNFMPNKIEYNDKVLLSSEIPLDENIVKELRNL